MNFKTSAIKMILKYKFANFFNYKTKIHHTLKEIMSDIISNAEKARKCEQNNDYSIFQKLI